MSYKIESGITIPPKNYQHTELHEAIAQLEVGDSFTIPTYTMREAQLATIVARRKGRKVVTRKDKKSGALRIWRVE